MKQYIIIVAGGSGSRMGSTIPKQFLDLNSKPILMHTIEKMHQSLDHSEIILALPKSEFDTWKKLCQEHQFKVNHQVVEGGNTRFESVSNALKKVNEQSVIAVHDGVRPLVKTSVVNECMQTALEKKAEATISNPTVSANSHRLDSIKPSFQQFCHNRFWHIPMYERITNGACQHKMHDPIAGLFVMFHMAK